MEDQVTKETNTETVPSPEMPEKKSNKMIFIVAAILVLIGIGVFATVGKTGGGAKADVLKAISATAKEFGKERKGFNEITGSGAILETLRKGTLEQKGSITITDLTHTDPTYEILKGSGLSFQSLSNLTEKKMSFDLSAAYKNTDFVSLDFYTDNEILMFGIPALLNGYITVNADTFVTDYNESVFGEVQPLPQEEFNLKAFPDQPEEEVAWEELKKAYLSATQNAQKTLIDNMKIEKMASPINITTKQGEKSCTGYELIARGEDLANYCKTVVTFLKTDPLVREVILVPFMSQYAMNSYNTPEEVEEELYDFFESLEEELTETFLDEVFQIAVDDQGRAVQFLAYDTTEEGEKVGEVCLSLLGDSNIFDQIQFLGKEEGQELFSIDFSTGYDESTKDYQGDFSLKAADSYDTVLLKGTLNYNDESKKLNVIGHLSDSVTVIDLEADGSFLADRETNSIEVILDTIQLHSKVNQTSRKYEDTLVFYADYTAQKADKEVTEPDGTKLEVLKMSEDEIYELINEIENNAMKMVMSIAFL